MGDGGDLPSSFSFSLHRSLGLRLGLHRPPTVQSGKLRSKAACGGAPNAEISAPRPRGPSLILWAVLRQIPRGPPPFPPFLPQLRAARQTARSTPRRAPTLPDLRTPLGPLSPGPATIVPGTLPPRPWFQTPLLAAPQAFGMPSVCPRRSSPRNAVPAPGCSTCGSPLSPPGVRPALPRAAPLRPRPPPAGRVRKVRREPWGRPVAPRRTDGRSPHVTCGSRRLPPNLRRRGSRALGPPPLPSPPRLSVRTFRSSLGRPGGSAHRPAAGLRTCTLA